MEYARQMVAVKKAMDEMEQRRRDFMQTQNKNLADFLATQKEEADTKKKTMNETFRNRVTPEYFMQFGTSHR